MPQKPPEVTPEVVRGDLTPSQLQTYLAAGAVAVDTETLGLRLLRDRLCLVQLCDASGHATAVQIPRELAMGSTPPAQRAPRLKQLLEDPRIQKVFHFARFDVAVLRYYLGIQVTPLYCTRTASKLVRTYTDRHGLKDISLELLDVELDKTARHTDWSNLDLKPEQIRYAISDVTLLLRLKEKLDDMLQREGRAAVAEECFRIIPTVAYLDLLGYDLLFEH